MTAAGPTVVVVGDLMVDVMALLRGPLVPASDSPAAISMRGGGSAANTACWLAGLGIETVFVGRVGDDLLGREAVRDLRDYGVRTAVAVDSERSTGTTVVLVGADGERTMVPDAGANSGLRPEDLPTDEFAAGRHLHLSGYTLLNPASRAAGLAALDLARRSGMTTSADPSSAGPLTTVGAERFLSWIRGVDLVFANEDEYAVLAANGPVEDCGEVIVKLGARGATAQPSDRRRTWISVPAARLSADVVDTTGAGDAFAAGFLVPWLQAGAGPFHAMGLGCAVAASAVVQVGGRPVVRNTNR